MRITLPRIGLGGAPLGNMFHPLSEETADATLNAAWDAGFRYYDVSPHYGAGLAEQRFGRLLSGKPRDEYVLSTKVGRLLQPAGQPENAKPFVDELPNKRVPDYSADGARRSIEDSLERMGVDRLDIVFIHDVSEDQWGPQWREYFQQAMNGAAKALTQLRDEGVIRGWGLGVNLVEPCRLALEQSDPNVFLLAGRYSLLEHDEALDTLFPTCQARDVGVVVGGPFNSGVLAGGDHYEYDQIPPQVAQRRSSSRPLPSAAASICGPPPCTSAWPTRWSPRSSRARPIPSVPGSTWNTSTPRCPASSGRPSSATACCARMRRCQSDLCQAVTG